MRIVYKPVMIPLQSHATDAPESVSLLVDPLRYDAAGVQEAADYYHPPRYVSLVDPTVGITAVKKALSERRDDIIYDPESISLPDNRSRRGDENFGTEAARYRGIVNNAIQQLPGMLKNVVGHEKLTIAIVEDFSEFATRHPDTQAFSGDGTNVIAIKKSYLDMPQQAVVDALKEEIIHHFDQKLGFSERREVNESASAVLADATHMAAVEKTMADMHRGKTLTPYENFDQPAELLAEYFIIRDHFKADESENAAYLGIKSRHSQADARVDKQMEAIFGNEYCQHCKDFEKQLQAIAAERSPQVTLQAHR
jgi:hypothetical protein